MTQPNKSQSWLQKMLGIASFYHWMTVVILLTAGFSIWETTHRDSETERHEFELNVEMNDGLNLTDTIAALYPDRGDTHKRKAIQAGECFNRYRAIQDNPSLPLPEVCRQYYSKPILDITQSHFEKGIAKGVKNDEKLYYQYLLFLIRTNADRVEIEKAYEQWRHLFPLSREIDPLIDEANR